MSLARSNFVEILCERSLRHPNTIAYQFLTDGERVQEARTYRQLDLEARAIGAVLQAKGLAGSRVILLYPPGLSFVSSFLGCLYAGVIAVPCHFPRTKRPIDRLQTFVDDAQPAAIVTSIECLESLQAQCAPNTALARLPIVTSDDVPVEMAERWRRHEPAPHEIAYLQYTSGSTSEPRGVKITHANLLANSRCISEAFGHHSKSRGVMWLPPHHDMGLIGGILQPLLVGQPVLLMSPVHVVQQPLRWLRAISNYRGTVSGGPNFMFDRCVETIGPVERQSLDLSCWEVAFNGSEPVRAETLDRFVEAFAPCGFRREALFPCYGLAEATLLVTGGPKFAGPIVRKFDKRSLERDREACPPQGSSPATQIVACGRPVSDLQVRIVDPDSLQPCRAGQLGEIWVSGPSVAQGYWHRHDDSTWSASLADSLRFLRTGDLGFMTDDQLFVAGRHKDLIIIDGRNHYPQDIELAIEKCHPALRSQRSAVFSVDREGSERLVVVSELHRNGRNTDASAVIQAIREAVSVEHELNTSAVALVRVGQIPQTTSGKVQRRLCRDQFQREALSTIAAWRCRELGGDVSDSESTPHPEPSAAVARLAPRSGNGSSARSDAHSLASRSSEEIRNWLVRRLQERQGAEHGVIDVQRPFDSFGLTSRDAVEISGELERWLGRRLSPALIYEFPTIELLSLAMSDDPQPHGGTRPSGEPKPRCGATVSPTDARSAVSEPIAIVGMGCRLPGAAGPDQFWRLLAAGQDAIREVPKDRWDPDVLQTVCLVPDHDPDCNSLRRGGFLEQIALFDADFFGIARREANCIDPQQRLLLEVSWEALEDAGQVLESLRGSKTGVFVGISTHDYGELCLANADGVEPYWSTGNATSIAANRLSYCLDLKGPSLAVDTACSSSLVAAHLACQSLRAGECDLALVGGVNAILTPTISANFAQAGGLAPDGRCKAFDARANGIVRSEGAGVLVLKRLGDAVQAGDRIYAVIVGGAINQDGRSNGITAPLQSSQEAVLREAYRRAAVSPGKVQYIETHGAGTMLGDVIEARALSAVLAVDRHPDERCAMGSVKTNIGHCEAAAGIAGLMKVALAMKHRQFPPNLHFVEPNPNIPFDEMPCYVQDRLAPWPEREGRRLAGVSSFGFGGTNAHLVLESEPQVTSRRTIATPRPTGDPGATPAYLLPLSAATPNALQAQAARTKELLDNPILNNPDLNNPENAPMEWADLCHAASVRRTHHRHRAAICFQTRDELQGGLESLARGEFSNSVATGVVPSSGRPNLAFVFSGHGGQWWGMAQQLLPSSPVFRRRIEECDRVLQRFADWSLVDELAADQPRSRLSGTEIDDLEISQTSLFAFQVALADVWQSWGIHPDAVVGHSVGEVAAACVAGVLELPDAMRLVVTRSRLLLEAARQAPGDTGMAAVRMSAEDVPQFLGDYQDRVWVSVYNSPKYTVLAGEVPVLEELIRALKKQKIGGRLMKVPGAGHTPQLEPTRIKLAALLADLRPQPGSIAFYSTVMGGLVAGSQLDADYWGRSVRQTVSFAPAIDQLVDRNFQAFVEVGPVPLLTAAIAQCCEHRDRKALVVPSMRPDEDHFVGLFKALGALHSVGCDVGWRSLYPTQSRWVSLPTYPWQHERFWLSPVEKRETQGQEFRSFGAGGGTSNGHSVQGPGFELADAPETRHWQFQLDPSSLPFLKDHHIEGRMVVPAAMFLEAALAAASEFLGPGPWLLQGLSLPRELSVTEDVPRPMQIALAREGADEGSLRIYAGRDNSDPPPDQGSPWQLVSECRLLRPAPARAGGDEGDPMWRACRLRCTEVVDINEHYAAMSHRGYVLGPSFRTLDEVWRGTEEALGRVFLPPHLASRMDGFVIHPVLIDACLQVLSAILPDANQAVFALTGAESVRVWSNPLPDAVLWSHVTCGPNGFAGGDSAFADIVVWDDMGQRVFEISGLRVQKLPAKGHEAEQLNDWLYEIQWRPQPLPAKGHLDDSPPPGTWIVFTDEQGAGHSLIRSLERFGQECLAVTPGDAFCNATLNHYTLDPGNPDHYRRLLQEVQTLGIPPLRGLVQLWGLRTGVAETTLDSLTAAEDLLSIGTLHLVQALDRTEFSVPPRIWLVTRCAQVVGRDPFSVSLEQAPLWGLGRTLQREHPAWRCTLVDLGAEADAGALGDELFADSEEDQLAFREGVRHIARLARPVSHRAVVSPSHPAVEVENFALQIHTDDGSPEFVLREANRHPPRRGEVELEVEAVGDDRLGLVDSWRGHRDPCHASFGLECAAQVLRVGEGVEGLCVGDRVLALVPGCFAARVTTAAELVVRRPDRWTSDQCAATTLSLLTAWHALVRLGNLSQGDRLLIHGADNPLGQAAVQIARRSGARILATVKRSQLTTAFYLCDDVLLLDADSAALAEQVLDATQGVGVDVVLDCGEAHAAVLPFRILRPLARYLEVVPAGMQPRARPTSASQAQNLCYVAIDPLGLILQRPDYCGALLREIVSLLDSGELSALPFDSVPLDRAIDVLGKQTAAGRDKKRVFDLTDRQLARVEVADSQPRFSAEATYLIAGGLGGLGLCVANWLIDRGAAHVVLMGRRAASFQTEQQLERLRAKGASVVAVQADLARREDVRRTIDLIRSDLPPLRGVFHCAAVMDDVVLALMKPEQWRAVTACKTAGAWNLHELTLGASLDFFVLFSSGAALIGPPGSGNYAAGNAFLDALADYRRYHGLTALTVNWGLWEGAGMVARSDQLQQQRIKLTGFKTIPAEAGVAALGRLMRADVTRMAVMPVDWAQLRRAARATTRTSFLEDVFLAAGNDFEEGDTIAEEVAEILANCQAAEPEHRRELLMKYLVRRLANTLGTAPEKVPWDRPLTELGIDSLMALELKNRIEEELKTSIRIVELLKGPTLAGFASILLKQLENDPGPCDADDGPAAPGARRLAATSVGIGKSAQDLLERIDELSSGEVEALYGQMLAEEESAQ